MFLKNCQRLKWLFFLCMFYLNTTNKQFVNKHIDCDKDKNNIAAFSHPYDEMRSVFVVLLKKKLFQALK